MGFTDVYDYVDGRADWFAAGLPGEGEGAEVARIGRLAVPAPSCGPDDTIGSVRAALGDDWELCCVLGGDGVVLGTLRTTNLDTAGATPARDVMNPAPSTFRPDVPMDQLRRWMGRHPEVDAAPVTSPEGRILGIVSRSRLDALDLAGTTAG